MATVNTDPELVFHPLKKIEIIVKGEKKAFVSDLLDRSGATGYTLIKDISGKGEHGFHEGRLLFNDTESLVMFVAVASDETIRSVASGLKPLFEKNSGVMFISDAQVVRLEHFMKKEEKAAS
jgi:nitrogen regulatory protein PII